MSRRAPIVGLALALLGCVAGAQDPRSAPRWVPGRVIVKFAPGTPAATAVEEALTGGSVDHAPLRGVLDELGERIQRPLAAERLTSGREVVVTLNGAQLMANVVALLGVRLEVAETRALDSDDPGVLSWRVDLTGSTTAEDLGRAIRSVAAPLELALGQHLETPTEARLELDLTEVTQGVPSRLMALDEVEYAELDQPVRHMRPEG